MPIIDGKNIKYSIRNGKILDEELITGRLVCYLNMLGDNNDNYRNILLDLSGNNKNGQLQNFNFTTNSGYTANGLKLDNVDDIVSISGFNGLNSYTVLFSFNLTDWDNTGNDLFKINNTLNLYQSFNYMLGLEVLSTGDIISTREGYFSNKLVLTIDGGTVLKFFLQDGDYNVNSAIPNLNLNSCTFKVDYFKGDTKDIGFTVEKFFVYNRVLNYSEIVFMLENYL